MSGQEGPGRLSIFGHSHTAALAAAAEAFDGVHVYREAEKRREGIDFDSFLARAQGTQIVLATGGSHHSALSTLDLGSIPYRAMLSYFKETIAAREGPYLRRLGGRQAIQLLPPPPKADNALLTSYHRALTGEVPRLSAPAMRLAAWQAYCAALRKKCAKAGVQVMGPPKQALDAEGFLLPEYHALDSTHANWRYGRLQIERLLASCG